jgi:hypothetical protein
MVCKCGIMTVTHPHTTAYLHKVRVRSKHAGHARSGGKQGSDSGAAAATHPATVQLLQTLTGSARLHCLAGTPHTRKTLCREAGRHEGGRKEVGRHGVECECMDAGLLSFMLCDPMTRQHTAAFSCSPAQHCISTAQLSSCPAVAPPLPSPAPLAPPFLPPTQVHSVPQRSDQGHIGDGIQRHQLVETQLPAEEGACAQVHMGHVAHVAVRRGGGERSCGGDRPDTQRERAFGGAFTA